MSTHDTFIWELDEPVQIQYCDEHHEPLDWTMDSRLAGGPSLFLISPEHTFFLPSALTFSLLSTHTRKGKHKFSHLSLFLPCLLSVFFLLLFFFFCRISTSKVQYCSGHLEKNPVWIYCCKFSLNVSLSLSLRLNSARGRVCVLQVCRFDSARIQITQTNRPDPFNGINVFSHKSCWCLSHPSQTLHLKPSRCIGDLLWGYLKQRVLN